MKENIAATNTPGSSTANTDFTPEALDKIQTALTRSVDARAGFETMVKKAEPELLPIARQFHDTHDQHAKQLSSLFAMHGRDPDADGSLMSTVNTAVVSARALFDEIDGDVMDNVRSGETHVLNALAEAAERVGDTQRENEIRAMIGDINALLDQTKHLD